MFLSWKFFGCFLFTPHITRISGRDFRRRKKGRRVKDNTRSTRGISGSLDDAPLKAKDVIMRQKGEDLLSTTVRTTTVSPSSLNTYVFWGLFLRLPPLTSLFEQEDGGKTFLLIGWQNYQDIWVINFLWVLWKARRSLNFAKNWCEVNLLKDFCVVYCF
jgi:hypothetical protein